MDFTDRSKTVGRIVAEQPATAEVFRAHGIDFCCQGEVTLEEACRAGGLELQELAAELQQAVARQPASTERSDELTTPALIGRIVQRHHGYLRQALPQIPPLLLKVATVHGERNPRLSPLKRAFDELRQSLEPHLAEEEQQLFPLLLAPPVPDSVAGDVLGRMLNEHRAVGTLLGELHELTDGFSTPEWGCASYRLLMRELAELEDDTLAHIHLENHVLLPRFVEPVEARRAARAAEQRRA